MRSDPERAFVHALPTAPSNAHLCFVAEEAPVPLVKRADLRESWFDAQQPPPRESSFSLPPPSIPRPTVGRSILAGVVAGAVAGVAFVGTAMVAAQRLRLPGNIARTIGTWVSRGALSGDSATYGAVGALAGVGLLLGTVLSISTRHVRRTLPLLMFGVIFAPVLWLAVHVFVLRRFSPGLAAELPFSAMTLGALAFGACFALVPALRGRGGAI